MKLGIDRLLEDVELRKPLCGRRAALLGHPASVTSGLQHSLEALFACPEVRLCSSFGPQHGMLGDKQDNMIESEDYIDQRLGIPVFSLYGSVRHPSSQMLETFDVLLVDLQDIGTRIYTFTTTLIYMLEACARTGKSVWVLDRPNPVGRPVEGMILEPGWESFVGAAPLIMRHGLTMGEIASWYAAIRGLSLDLRVVEMQDYKPEQAPGFGWPSDSLSWVNPSPNASSLNMARCFPGTVLIEGTTLSEGRGTSLPLELLGAPDIETEVVLKRMRKEAPEWLGGCLLRACCFEPTFHKHKGHLCRGFQIHTDHPSYLHHSFKPYRLVSLFLKSLRLEYPDYPLWREFAYEYELDRAAVDLLSGGSFLRAWVDDSHAGVGDFEQRLQRDERRWLVERQGFLRY